MQCVIRLDCNSHWHTAPRSCKKVLYEYCWWEGNQRRSHAGFSYTYSYLSPVYEQGRRSPYSKHS